MNKFNSNANRIKSKTQLVLCFRAGKNKKTAKWRFFYFITSSQIKFTALFSTRDFAAILSSRDGLSNNSDSVDANQRGVNLDCSTAKPPPVLAKDAALAAWSGLIFNGTNIAG